MLKVWLRRSDPPPTWSALIDALQSPTVGHKELAEYVKSVHVGKFIGWYTCDYSIMTKPSDKIILGITFIIGLNLIPFETQIKVV